MCTGATYFPTLRTQSNSLAMDLSKKENLDDHFSLTIDLSKKENLDDHFSLTIDLSEKENMGDQ